MVSASHNPPEDNGIKLFAASGAKLSRVLLFNADLTGASFRGAVIDHCDFSGARLDGCDFTDAVILETDLP